GITAGALDLAGYAVCFYLLAVTTSWLVRVPLAIVQMAFIARLFVLGHDACHGALFRPRSWNRILGRIFFLPSITPYTLWEFAHNSVHHSFSNLKSRDYVWTPFSPVEWLRLSKPRRCLERLYRSPLGLGPYYFLELWWKRLYFPSITSMSSFRPA